MPDENLSSVDKYFIQHHDYTGINSGIRFHNGFEFIYVKKSSVRLDFNDKSIILNAGQGFLLLPDTVHSYKGSADSECYICIFSEKYLPEINRISENRRDRAKPFSVPYGNEITDLLKNAGDEFMNKGMIYAIASMAYGRKENREAESLPVDIADKIMQYIEKNYTFDISLSDVAEDLNYQYNYLSKLINRIFKMSFSKLLNKYRIYTAQQLLKNTDKSITLIADSCGYASVRSFNRNFKKITGLTPSEYLDSI